MMIGAGCQNSIMTAAWCPVNAAETVKLYIDRSNENTIPMTSSKEYSKCYDCIYTLEFVQQL